MKARHLQILRQVLSIPSVPFHEEGVVEFVRRWAGDRGVRFGRDEAGNVLLRYARGARRAGHWVLAAHMDHPGFLVHRQRGTPASSLRSGHSGSKTVEPRPVWAEFRGSVAKGYGLGCRVRLFAPGGEVTAAVATRRAIRGTNWWTCRLDLHAAAEVPPGTLGMWDFPGARVRGRRLTGRACDDLAGTAAVVCALDEIVCRKIQTRVTGLLTRAEEAGAIGAAAACAHGSIPRAAWVVAIEASKAQPGAGLGDGVVIRVGDSVRTFAQPVTACMTAAARDLSRRDRGFRYVRQLMPGGMCESTLYCSWGYAAGGLCLPLGNYHNMADDGRIGPERIDLGDFDSMVRLLVALASRRCRGDSDRAIRQRFRRLLRERGHLL